MYLALIDGVSGISNKQSHISFEGLLPSFVILGLFGLAFRFQIPQTAAQNPRVHGMLLLLLPEKIVQIIMLLSNDVKSDGTRIYTTSLSITSHLPHPAKSVYNWMRVKYPSVLQSLIFCHFTFY